MGSGDRKKLGADTNGTGLAAVLARGASALSAAVLGGIGVSV